MLMQKDARSIMSSYFFPHVVDENTVLVTENPNSINIIITVLFI